MKYTYLFFILMAASSCKKSFYTDANINPNAPSPNSIVPSVLLPSVEGALAYMQGGDLSRFSALSLQQVKGNARQAQAFYQYTYTLQDFDAAWAEGAALSTEEAIVSAQRGHGERKRPANGWASLTAAERDVVRLVTEGLANNDIATRLFVSPRTVQTHLTHVYSKLGLTSRVQLAQEAARHG